MKSVLGKGSLFSLCFIFLMQLKSAEAKPAHFFRFCGHAVRSFFVSNENLADAFRLYRSRVWIDRAFANNSRLTVYANHKLVLMADRWWSASQHRRGQSKTVDRGLKELEMAIASLNGQREQTFMALRERADLQIGRAKPDDREMVSLLEEVSLVRGVEAIEEALDAVFYTYDRVLPTKPSFELSREFLRTLTLLIDKLYYEYQEYPHRQSHTFKAMRARLESVLLLAQRHFVTYSAADARKYLDSEDCENWMIDDKTRGLMNYFVPTKKNYALWYIRQVAELPRRTNFMGYSRALREGENENPSEAGGTQLAEPPAPKVKLFSELWEAHFLRHWEDRELMMIEAHLKTAPENFSSSWTPQHFEVLRSIADHHIPETRVEMYYMLIKALQHQLTFM